MARAVLREPGLPEAFLAGPEQDARLLVDHRDDLVDERKRRRIALDQLGRVRELTKEIRSFAREFRGRMRGLSSDLMAMPGCSAICAAHLIGQTAGASRFSGDAATA